MSSIAYLENSLHSWEKEGFGEFLFMLGRVGFVLAASVAAYAVKRPKAKASRLKPSENGGASTTKNAEVEAAQKEQDEDSSKRKEVEKEEEEEEEEVKTISSFINASSVDPSNAAAPDVQQLDNDDVDDEKLLPEEFESLLTEEMDDIPLPENNKYDDVEVAADIKGSVELERVRRLVEELEGELLVYYGLEEDLVDLQKQLMTKTEEVEMLNITIRSLQEEVAAGAAATKELEVLRSKNEELQRQILELDAGGGGGTSAWTTPW